jgi:hypothetical protein
MDTQENFVQITIYYLDGESEAFNVYAPPEDKAATLPNDARSLMQQPFLVFNLPEQTVIVNMANVAKLEVKPPQELLPGENVLNNADRVTALDRMR